MITTLLNWLRPGRERSFALNDLDLKLAQYLDFRDGFFIEAGANDGRTQSNTLFFERFRGWRGLLVEPIPALARRCRRNRPRCIVENCALVASDDGPREVTMRTCNLMSVVKGAFSTEEAETAHLERGRQVQKLRDRDLQEVRVPARTLSSLLDQHGVQGVDLLSLDVEGYELEVLKGLDFTRHAPRFLLVESRDRDALRALIDPFYEPVADLSHHDLLFRRRNDPPRT